MKKQSDLENSLPVSPKRASKGRKVLKSLGTGIFGALMGLSTLLTPDSAVAQSVTYRPSEPTVQVSARKAGIQDLKAHARQHELYNSNYKQMFKGLDNYPGFEDNGSEERFARELLKRFPSLAEDLNMWYLIARDMPTQLKVEKGRSLAEAVNDLVYNADPTSLFSKASPKQQDNAVRRAHEAMRGLSKEAQRRYAAKASRDTFLPVEDEVMIGLVQGFLEVQGPEKVAVEEPVEEEVSIEMPKRVGAGEIEANRDAEAKRKAELAASKKRLDQLLESGAEEKPVITAAKEVPVVDRCEAKTPYDLLAKVFKKTKGMIKGPEAKVQFSPDAIRAYKDDEIEKLKKEYKGCTAVLAAIGTTDKKLGKLIQDYECRSDQIQKKLAGSEADLAKVKSGELKAKDAFGARDKLEKEIRKECPADEYANAEGLISASRSDFNAALKKNACGTPESFSEKLEGTDLTKIDGFTGKNALAGEDAYMRLSEVEKKLNDLDKEEIADAEVCPENRTALDNAKTQFGKDAAAFICRTYTDSEIETVKKSYTLELQDMDANSERVKSVAEARLRSTEAECVKYTAKIGPEEANKLEKDNKAKIDAAEKDLDNAVAAHAKAQKNRIVTTISVEGHDPSFESEAGSGDIYARIKNGVDADKPIDASVFLTGSYDTDSLKTAWSAGGVFDLHIAGFGATFGFAGDWPDFNATSNSIEPGMLEYIDADNFTELRGETEDAKAAENNRNWSLELSIPILKNVDIRASYAFTKSGHDEHVNSRSDSHTAVDKIETDDGINVHKSLDIYVDSDADMTVKSETEMHSAGLGADFRLGNWTLGGDLLAHYAESDIDTRTDTSVTTTTEGFVEVMGQRIPANGIEGPDRSTDIQSQKYIQRVVDVWAHAMFNGEAAAGWLAVGVPSVTGEDEIPKGDSALPVMFDLKGFYHDGGFLIGGGVTHITDNLDLNLYIASDAKTQELLNHLRTSSTIERISVMDSDLRAAFIEKGLEYSIIQDSEGWYANVEAEFALRDSADSAGNINARIVTPVLGDVFRLGLTGSKDFTDSTGFGAGADFYFRLGSRNHTLKLGVEAKNGENSDSTEAGVNLEYVLRF